MAQRAYRPPPSGAASLSAFERFIQQPVLRSAPPGPPSRQWLARQQQLSTQPMGLGAVAGLPTQGPAEEELAPLPPSREVEELPRGRGAVGKRSVDARAAGGSYLRLPPTGVSSMAPGSPFEGGVSPIREPGGIGGERVLSTLRPGGIGLLGESEQEMNERLNREEAAEAVLSSPGLIKAVGLNQMSLPSAISAESAERKHGEDRTKAEKEALEKAGKLQTQKEALYDRALDVFAASGVEWNEARRQADVVSNLDSSAARQVLQDIRAATEKKAERTQREGLAELLPGSIGRGAGVGQPQHVLEFKRGARTYAGARTAGASARRRTEKQTQQQNLQARVDEFQRRTPAQQAADLAQARQARARGDEGADLFLANITELRAGEKAAQERQQAAEDERRYQLPR